MTADSSPEPWQDLAPPPWVYSLFAHYQARELSECDAIISQHGPTEVIEWLIVTGLVWAGLLYGDHVPLVLANTASLAEAAEVMDGIDQP